MALSKAKMDELKKLLNGEEISGDQLHELNRVIIEASRAKSYQVAGNFRKGQKVQFTSRRDHTTYTGTVQKVNPKNIEVKVPGEPRNFLVPATMLSVVS